MISYYCKFGVLEQLHYDDEDNLHLIIHGHKRWHIFPPNAPLQYPSLHTLFGSSSGHIIQSDPCTSPLQAETQSQLTPIVITLSPGDLLYVPAAWSHEVQSVPDSPTSFVFSVNKFYPTSIFQCARRGSGWAVARCKLWNYKLNRGGWK